MQVTWTRKRVDRLVGLRKEDPPPTEIVRPLGCIRNVVASMPGDPQFKAYSDPELTEFATGNNRKVRRRGSPLCRAVAHGSLAATLLWALPAQAADDVTELLVQVKKQLEQSQRQMEQSQRQLEQNQRQLEQSQREVKALKQQVEVLTKRVEQTPVAAARSVVPAPDAKDVVVMQQPGNLPGDLPERKQEQAPAATGPPSSLKASLPSRSSTTRCMTSSQPPVCLLKVNFPDHSSSPGPTPRSGSTAMPSSTSSMI